MLNKKEFEKVIENIQGFFYFRFIGEEKILFIDYEKLCLLLDNYFDKIKSYDDLRKIVCDIRTIFSSFNEEYLEIQLNLSNIYKVVKYSNKELIFYEKDEQINSDEKLNVKYDLKNLCVTSTQDKLSLENLKKKEDYFNNNLVELQQLMKVDYVELTTKDKALCLCYKLFYDELPDFSSKDINIKMQVMLSILLDFDICLIEEYDFKLNSKNIPVSYRLSKDINRLIPVGKLEKLDNSVVLDREVAKRVKIIGEETRKYLSKNEFEVDGLKKLGKILYSSRCCVPTYAAIETIADICDCSIDEVDSSIKLVKFIDRKF